MTTTTIKLLKNICNTMRMLLEPVETGSKSDKNTFQTIVVVFRFGRHFENQWNAMFVNNICDHLQLQHNKTMIKQIREKVEIKKKQKNKNI